MAKIEPITVTVRARDEASPVIRRVARRLWWMQYGGMVLFATCLLLMVLVVVLAFAVGRITA